MQFARSFLGWGIASTLLCALVVPPVPGATTHSRDERISLPIDEWLAQGEHKSFTWEVHVSHPALTFQQRYRLWVTASVDTRSLQSRSVERDLHFVLKVADEEGKWFDGDTYNELSIKKKFGRSEDIQFEAGLYLQPGAYTVAVVIYDAVLNEHNTSFTHVVVKPPARDEFPGLLDGLPKVEFLPIPVEGLASLAAGHASLTVPTKEPVQFDLIVDLGLPVQPAPSRVDPDQLPGPSRTWPQRTIAAHRMELPTGVRNTVKGYQSRLLEAASVLGDLNFPEGCTSVTVINSLKRRTIMNAQPAISADWAKTWTNVVNTDLNLVSADELSGTAQAARFFSDQVESVIQQDSRCDSDSRTATRIVGVLSAGAQFPQTNSLPNLEQEGGCRVFYLQQSEEGESLISDNLPKMLAALHPIHLRFSNPGEFRRKLSEFVKTIAAIEKGDHPEDR